MRSLLIKELFRLTEEMHRYGTTREMFWQTTSSYSQGYTLSISQTVAESINMIWYRSSSFFLSEHINKPEAMCAFLSTVTTVHLA